MNVPPSLRRATADAGTVQPPAAPSPLATTKFVRFAPEPTRATTIHDFCGHADASSHESATPSPGATDAGPFSTTLGGSERVCATAASQCGP